MNFLHPYYLLGTLEQWWPLWLATVIYAYVEIMRIRKSGKLVFRDFFNRSLLWLFIAFMAFFVYGNLTSTDYSILSGGIHAVVGFIQIVILGPAYWLITAAITMVIISLLSLPFIKSRAK